MFPVWQEITKDKRKKTINLHNYFNILFFKYYFSNICLNLSLNFCHLSQWRHVFMYVCELCPGAQNQIAHVWQLCGTRQRDRSHLTELVLGSPSFISCLCFLIWFIWVPDLLLTYSLSENEGRKRGKLPPHHQMIWRCSAASVKIRLNLCHWAACIL